MRHNSVLFFSRGRGRGHAVPDVAIAADLLKADPHCEVLFASYGTGAATIRELGYAVIDLGLPEANTPWETIVRAAQLIQKEAPDVVVSHEELWALPAAKIYARPTVYITDWFPADDDADCLAYADEIVFTDDRGYFDEPVAAAGKIHYTGQVFRFDPETLDKNSARRALGVPLDTKLILVIPGGSDISSEHQTPIAALVLDAFNRLSFPSKYLIWIAPEHDQELLLEKCGVRNDIRICKPHSDVHLTMIAADVAITKGTRKTSFELAALGVPSISLSHGRNPIDDRRVGHIPTNRAVRVAALDGEYLSELLDRAFRMNIAGLPPAALVKGRAAILDRLLANLEKVRRLGSEQRQQ